MFGNDEINKVYEAVDKVFRLRIKSQLNHSEIIFNKFLFVKDIVLREEYYYIDINDKVLKFVTVSEFYKKFLSLLNDELKQTEADIKDFEYHRGHDKVHDENAEFFESERLYMKEEKLLFAE